MYTVLQMFNRTSLVLVGHTDILDAPPCVWAALRCLAPGPTWHHASVNWPDWLSLSFDFSDCFYYSLTFNFLQLWWESGENEFKAHEERNRKAFYSVLKRERFFFFFFSLETILLNSRSLDFWGHSVSTSSHPGSAPSKGSLHTPFQICRSGKSPGISK